MQVATGGIRFARIDAAEHRLCVHLNRGARLPWLRNLFAAASRLGDGVFWYALMMLLPILHGPDGAVAALRMALTGLAGVLLYKCLKSRLVRERPFVSLAGVVAATVPLDRYSFPSGHTLQAVSLSTLAAADFPELGWIVWPFTLLVAGSRPVLGLHYPSDVAAGALLGGTLAATALQIG